jgi:hypothetical protein
LLFTPMFCHFSAAGKSDRLFLYEVTDYWSPSDWFDFHYVDWHFCSFRQSRFNKIGFPLYITTHYQCLSKWPITNIWWFLNQRWEPNGHKT